MHCGLVGCAHELSLVVDPVPPLVCCCWVMSVQIREGSGLADHSVEVQSLRIGQVSHQAQAPGIADQSSGEPAAEAGGVVAGAEIVVVGIGVALLAFEFVVWGTAYGYVALAAVGVEVGS